MVILITFILLSIVFFPKIRYNIKAAKNSLEEPLFYDVSVTYLMGIIRITLINDAEPLIKIFGIKLKTKTKDVIDEEIDNDTEQAVEKTKKKRKSNKGSNADAKATKESPLDTLRDYNELYKHYLGSGGIKAVLACVFELIKEILLKILPKTLHVRGVIGLDEPDKTGMLFALIATLQVKFDMQIAGDFEKETLNIKGHARGGFRLISFVWPVVRFLRKDTIRKLRSFITAVNKMNKKKKLKRERMLKNGYRV